MPFTAASETVRSTFLTVSFAVSSTEARRGVVERKRVWRAKGTIRERAKDMIVVWMLLWVEEEAVLVFRLLETVRKS